eukprot:gnl/TRDRNA2_/TRDRNA2_163016_c0_seq1.p1 gnl/TRDRNA2_/TRDRNA2_163016_c0~~gnl/TRDRNA2_/TRDRNA2_163016_c0_seq1.p1  ORF type:complete len:558 (-),score=64.54 gnl/TRDRNA2_/TRDRNA2_163016_c0_seq1:54-1727(-)
MVALMSRVVIMTLCFSAFRDRFLHQQLLQAQCMRLQTPLWATSISTKKKIHELISDTGSMQLPAWYKTPQLSWMKVCLNDGALFDFMVASDLQDEKLVKIIQSCWESKFQALDGFDKLLVGDAKEGFEHILEYFKGNTYDRFQRCTLLDDHHISALVHSSSFCPLMRGQRFLSTDTYLPQPVAPPYLIGRGEDREQLRYEDPLYTYARAEELLDPKRFDVPPFGSKFINMNQLYPFPNADSADVSNIAARAGHELWIAQCPLAGQLEGRDVNNVCEWLSFVQNTGATMLFTLAPNAIERGKKGKCTDYIELIMTKKLTHCGPSGTEEDGALPVPITVISSEPLFIQSEAYPIVRRQFYFNNDEETVVTQLYYFGWPDAHGEDNPAVPDMPSLKYMLQVGLYHEKVIVHCAGGRGRSGTLAFGIIQQWRTRSRGVKAYGREETRLESLTAEGMVKDLVRMRASRADIVEHNTQFMALVQALNEIDPTNFALDQRPRCELRYDTMQEVIVEVRRPGEEMTEQVMWSSLSDGKGRQAWETLRDQPLDIDFFRQPLRDQPK